MNARALLFTSPDRAAYADGTGYIRVREKRDLLNHVRLQEWLALAPAGILERLRQSVPAEVGAGAALDSLIGRILDDDHRDVERFDHQGLAVGLLRLRHDAHNLRALLRSRRTGLPPAWSPVAGTVPVARLEEALRPGNELDLPPAMADAVGATLPHGDAPPAGDADDVALDAAWLADALDLARAASMPLVAHWLKCLSDFAAARLVWRHAVLADYHLPAFRPSLHFLDEDLWRVRDRQRLADFLLASSYAPSLRDGLAALKAGDRWALVERDMDDHLTEVLAGTRYVAMGPEPLLSYLVARENDLKNIRTISVLKEAGFPEAEVKRHLRRPHA